LPWAERVLPNWTKREIIGVEIWKWIGIFLAFFLGLLLNFFSKSFFMLLLKFAKKTKTDWDEKIIVTLYRPIGYLLAISFWFIFLYSTGIDGKPFKVFDFILKTLLGMAFVYFAYSLSDLLVDFFRAQAVQSKSPLDEQLIPLLSQSIRVLLVIIGILVAIQNMGVNVMSLVAGLGIGGLAIALAAKDTAANLFGSVMIFMDKPFKVGDHILLSNVEGTVEAIGFRSTRIRTWEDSLVTIPNSVVANVNIENLGSRRFRRTNLVIGVTYDTSPEKMEAFLESIKNILFASPVVVKDMINVGFREFGNSSLNVLLHFYVNVDTFAKNLEARQLIFLEVMRAAKSLDISFAFPTTTVHMETFPGQAPTRIPQEFSEETYKEKAKEYSQDSKTSKIDGAGIYTPAYKVLEKDQNSTVI
jgi:MscS family membrane protein